VVARRVFAFLALIALATSSATLPVAAHETDQYTLPVGREFADLGDYFTAYFYGAIDRGVDKTNARIRAEISAGRSAAQFQTAEYVTRAVNKEFPYAISLIEGLDTQMTSIASKDRWPGALPGYKPPPSMKKFLLYPLNPFRAWNCATVNLFGVHLGTDKVGHFTDMGMHYWQTYSGYRKKGETEEQAMRRAISVGADDPVKGESKLLGYWTAGAYSNADMAVNYLGLIFYRNLTEPQMLKGQMRPPMIVRDGEYWKIAPHVARDSGFFAWFISDHIDEALNPSHYLDGMRAGMRKMANESATSVLENRLDKYGNRHSQEYFYKLARELRTYYGVDYGHVGRDAELVLIDAACFPNEDEQAASVGARDRFGRTALHRAAERGDARRVTQLLAAGAQVNAQIRSDEPLSSDWGDTPLHLAALNGRAEVVKLLIARGADVNAANDRGATALHLAVEHPAVIGQLLAAGAKIDAIDARGRTPLHWAALGSAQQGLAALLDHGASANVQDHEGQTPLHLAARAGNATTVTELLRGGADMKLADTLGVTPLHLATTTRARAAADVLVRAGAPVDARDALGSTPLHEAARRRSDAAVALLLNAGAQATVADRSGATPLHIASRRGDTSIARLLLSKGADAHVKAGPRGISPLEEAKRTGNAALVTLLQDDESRAGAASHRQ
jgi:ankyrin repeat protein